MLALHVAVNAFWVSSVKVVEPVCHLDSDGESRSDAQVSLLDVEDVKQTPTITVFHRDSRWIQTHRHELHETFVVVLAKGLDFLAELFLKLSEGIGTAPSYEAELLYCTSRSRLAQLRKENISCSPTPYLLRITKVVPLESHSKRELWAEVLAHSKPLTLGPRQRDKILVALHGQLVLSQINKEFWRMAVTKGPLDCCGDEVDELKIRNGFPVESNGLRHLGGSTGH
jgi:hypothetical protein